MSKLVVVAIPSDQDRIWKLSSEKIPHMTLLFLGEAEGAEVAKIMQFVQHATGLSEHGPFYLDVERRGTLGEDQADVLFFSKRSWSLKWIKQFRAQLLKNEAVRKAYDSTEQFPEWNPHLTLGYPATPSKAVDDDRHIYSVEFDRIAIWTGDFDGPEFQLEWPEREESMDVAWSEKGAEAVDDILHYGTKGMRWGVRSSQSGSLGRGKGNNSSRMRLGRGKGNNSSRMRLGRGKVNSSSRVRLGHMPKKIERSESGGAVRSKVGTAINNTNFRTNANSTRNVVKLINEASEKTKKNELPAINAKYKGKAKTSKEVYITSLSKVPVQKAYREEVRKAYEKNLNGVAQSKTNKSNTLRYEITGSGITGKQTATKWRVKTVKVKHADLATEEEYDILLVEDTDGFITDFKIESVEDALAQDSLNDEETLSHLMSVGEQFIEHYGKKGMRWGIRGSSGSPTAVAPRATSKVPQGDRRRTKIETKGGQNHKASPDAIKVAQARVKLHKSGPSALSNQELREVTTRLQLEQQAVQVTRSGPNKFVRDILGQQGKQAANQTVRTQVEKQMKKG